MNKIEFVSCVLDKKYTYFLFKDLPTLFVFWQHVALMHPSSVVGQSSAQQSCDPLTLRFVEIPSENIYLQKH